MNESTKKKLKSALCYGGSLVLGALITLAFVVFEDDIKAWFYRPVNKELEGKWDCMWTVNNPTGDLPDVVNDVIEIEEVTDERIVGSVTRPGSDYGEYVLSGYNSSYATTFRYTGVDAGTANLVGIILFKKYIRNDLLSGVWWQLYTPRRSKKQPMIVGGGVDCSRQVPAPSI